MRQVIIPLFGWDKAQKDEMFNAPLCKLGHFYFSSLNGGKTVHHFVACPWFALSFTWRAMDHDSGFTELSVKAWSPRVERDNFDLYSLNQSAFLFFCRQICMEFVLHSYQAGLLERRVQPASN